MMIELKNLEILNNKDINIFFSLVSFQNGFYGYHLHHKLSTNLISTCEQDNPVYGDSLIAHAKL